ncbi:Flagellar hook-associated protein flgK [Xanthomonas hortorum pv. vitians]|nr:Flagellar hook-associated protein flgK [Xanthomonas hortorum pv. vitians]
MCSEGLRAVPGLCVVGISRHHWHTRADVHPAPLGVAAGRCRGRIRHRSAGAWPGAGSAGLALSPGQCRVTITAACACVAPDGARIAPGAPAGLNVADADAGRLPDKLPVTTHKIKNR